MMNIMTANIKSQVYAQAEKPSANYCLDITAFLI